jgi:23S rRNA (uracil1939-C5)-methyltransferase
MFPHTAYVETVVLLSQQKPSDRIDVDLDLGELDVTRAETKATYAEIKDYVLKEHGLKLGRIIIWRSNRMQDSLSARMKRKKLLWMR